MGIKKNIKKNMKDNIKKNSMKDVKILEFQQQLLSWYDSHARSLPWRDEPTPYRVWVSEIMLQQTRVDTVKPYFERFIAELQTIGDLADAQEQRLLKLWEGLGYYSRARNLKKAAMEVMRDYNGQLPSSAGELIKLTGIGPYSAGAIASIAFGNKATAIDGNVLRVIARITANFEDIAQTETKEEIGELVHMLLPDKRTGDFNQALMELGATVCLPNGAPKCEICPINTLCTAFSENITDQIPVKVKKKARRVEQKTVFVIHRDHKTAVGKRPDGGLLQGLWEFPSVEGSLTIKECEAVMRSWGIQASRIEPLKKSKHIFTHVQWHMTGYLIHTGDCKSAEIQESKPQESISQGNVPQESISQGNVPQESKPQESVSQGNVPQEKMFIWATPQELKLFYTIPAAFKAYMEAACSWGDKEYR